MTVECLSHHVSVLTETCKRQILRVAELQADDYHLDRPLFYACRDDRERFCADINAGAGRVYQCLYRHKFARDMTIAVSESVGRSVGRSLRRSLRRSASQSLNRSASQSLNLSASQSASQSLNRSASQSASQSASESLNQPVSQSASQSASRRMSEWSWVRGPWSVELGQYHNLFDTYIHVVSTHMTSSV